MTVTNVSKDPENLTMTLTTDLGAGVDRVWQMWQDPRLLEKWWGPPTYPATFEKHDLTPGGIVTYFMTGPEGDLYPGHWRILTVRGPHLLEFEDGFADENGVPDPEMPVTRVRVDIEASGAAGDASLMTISSNFPSKEAMEQLIEMGMEEGLTLAVGQIDSLL